MAWPLVNGTALRALAASIASRAPRPIRPRTGAALRGARFYASSSAEGTALGQTPLYDLHVRHGAKMVPFGGYSMPVQYSDLSVGESHHWTREKASLFDVSHMVQYHVSGPGAEGLLMRLTPTALPALPVHQSTLSAFLHPGTGGIVDDAVITRLGPELFYVVTNAGCREKDAKFLTESIEAWQAQGNPSVVLTPLDGQGLIALQGPQAAEILSGVLEDPTATNLKELYFGQSKYLRLRLPSRNASGKVLVSRGGYTGEDGFEISIPPTQTVETTELLLNSAGSERLRLAGLGARDSLRLEAGMCLYGHDLDDTTTPVEGGLSWIIGKDRRIEGGFNGAETIIPQLTPRSKGGKGVNRRRVGLVVEGAPAREGAEIVDTDGTSIGRVTSGCPSPTLKKNVAMGYVKDGKHKSGTELAVVVRGRRRKATVTKMPFVPSKYCKAGASPA
ncbi:hypothetical protein BJ546DRAFT_844690 [Cryomyces antarcticus]